MLPAVASPHRCAFPALLVAAFVALATTYNFLTPPWEAPDEVAHFGFAEHVVRHRTLPVPDATDAGETHQPPLYYAILAATIVWVDLDDASGRFRFNRRARIAGAGDEVNVALHGSDESFPFRGIARALHVGRAVSTALGAATVLVAIALTAAIVGARGPASTLAGALVSLNPQFAFIGGAVSNDAMLSAVAGGALLALLHALSRPEQWSRWLCAGVLCALALLTKLSALPLLPVAALALVAGARGLTARSVARNAALVVAPLGVLSGWWFARNHHLLGDPLGLAWSQRALRQVLRAEPFGASDLLALAHTQFCSFWALFGWMTVPAPRALYVALAAFTTIAAAGFARVVAGRARLHLESPRRQALVLLVAAIALQEAFLLAAVQRFDGSWYQGRYMFPVLAPIATVLSVGTLGPLPERLRARVALAVVAFLLCVALALPCFVLVPAYAGAGSASPGILTVDIRAAHRAARALLDDGSGAQSLAPRALRRRLVGSVE